MYLSVGKQTRRENDMKTYKFQVIAANGIVNATKTIICKSSAKTPHGIYLAMGKAVAKTIGTDVFECKPKAIWMDGVAKNHPLGAWHSMTIDRYAEHCIWTAAHDVIMDGMLV